jgi:hypothetical protein
MPSRSAVRRLFAVAAAVLVIQYGIVGIVGVYASEPWPAVVLPAFKQVYATSGGFRVEQAAIDVVFDAQEPGHASSPDRRSVPNAEFLGMMPRSHHSSFLSEQCQPASLSGTDATETCRRPQARRWIVERASALFPHRSVARVDVVWSRLHFDPAARTSSTTPLDTLHLSAPSP